MCIVPNTLKPGSIVARSWLDSGSTVARQRFERKHAFFKLEHSDTFEIDFFIIFIRFSIKYRFVVHPNTGTASKGIFLTKIIATGVEQVS